MKHVSILGMCMLSLIVHKSDAAKMSDEFRRALVNGAQACVVVSVCDDEGNPVCDAAVRATVAKGIGERSFAGRTNVKGQWILSSDTTGNYIKVWVEKDGYYSSNVTFSYIDMGAEHEVKDGKWQPYGADEKIQLRKILSPVRMVSHVDGRFAFSMAATNVVFGFDMTLNDWVTPYGKGKIADFNVEFQSDGLPPNASKFSRITLSFPEPLGGAYEAGLQSQSDFKGPYFADTNRFANVPVVLENTWTKSGRQRGGAWRESHVGR